MLLSAAGALTGQSGDPCASFADAGRQAGAWRARLRINLTYGWRHRRLPCLARPTLFTELVQARKLHDRDPRLPSMADKVAVKSFVLQRLGPDWVTPTLWQGAELPDQPVWPLPFVVKSRHGCNQRAFVRTGTEDWPGIRAASRRWMRKPYGRWLDEWLYRDIERGLLVEPFVGEGRALPVDYKFYVFGGRVAFIQVHLEREHAHRWILFDRAWRTVSTDREQAPPPPPCLSAMIAAAEALGRDFDFVRTDFYEVDGSPRFGEMTFYPGSGLDRFDPPALDAIMGRLWLRARHASMTPPALDLAGDRGLGAFHRLAEVSPTP